jgi:hypothetical protein
MERVTKAMYDICIYGNITTNPLYNYHKLIKIFFKKNEMVNVSIYNIIKTTKCFKSLSVKNSPQYVNNLFHNNKTFNKCHLHWRVLYSFIAKGEGVKQTTLL